MLTKITPRQLRDFNDRLDREFGLTFSWLSSTLPRMDWRGQREERKLVEVPASDVYELRPVLRDGASTDLYQGKAEVVLVDLLSEYVYESPEVSQVERGRKRVVNVCVDPNTGGLHGKWETRTVRHWNLRLPLYVGPFAPPAVMEYITRRWPNPGVNLCPPDCSPTARTVRYGFGERVTLPGHEGDPAAYFLTSYRRPSSIGGYVVMKEITEDQYHRLGDRDGVNVCWVPCGADYGRFFMITRPNKLEKFYPEEER